MSWYVVIFMYNIREYIWHVIDAKKIFRISHFSFDDKYTTTNLRVITIEKKQYANYTCKAFNVLVSTYPYTNVPMCVEHKKTIVILLV
jgi:hypothetical protein